MDTTNDFLFKVGLDGKYEFHPNITWGAISQIAGQLNALLNSSKVNPPAPTIPEPPDATEDMEII